MARLSPWEKSAPAQSEYDTLEGLRRWGRDPVQHDDNFKLGILAAARAVDGSLDSGVEEL